MKRRREIDRRRRRARSLARASARAEVDARNAADARQAGACEEIAIAIDHGIGLAAVEAIAVLPPGPRRDFEVATWAKRIAAAPGAWGIAVVVDDNFSAEKIAALAELFARARIERAAARGAS